MTTKHYSEADLLETYYTQPGDSMPVMMHLAECEECAARYERLERKVRGLGACEHDKPETFWARQRISIMKKIESQQQPSLFARSARYAAAAALILILGGVVAKKEVSQSHSLTVSQPHSLTASQSHSFTVPCRFASGRARAVGAAICLC